VSYTSVSDSSKGLNQAGRINEAGALQESDQIRYGWPRNRTEIVQNKDGIAKFIPGHCIAQEEHKFCHRPSTKLGQNPSNAIPISAVSPFRRGPLQQIGTEHDSLFLGVTDGLNLFPLLPIGEALGYRCPQFILRWVTPRRKEAIWARVFQLMVAIAIPLLQPYQSRAARLGRYEWSPAITFSFQETEKLLRRKPPPLLPRGLLETPLTDDSPMLL
jgi:hypothetical protein